MLQVQEEWQEDMPLIYNQQNIPKQLWRYGHRSSAATGCGWIAAYNALCLLGYRPKEEKIISFFEKHIPVINGNLGTFLLTPAALFRRCGFDVKMFFERDGFDRAAKGGDVCLLFYRWHKKHKFGAHFVALQYRDGNFYGYNTYRNSKGPDCYGPSLEAFLKRRKYYLAVLTVVKKQ